MALGILGALTGMALVVMLVGLVVSAFFLWLSARIFSLKDKSFMTPIVITLISAVVGWILGVIGAMMGPGKYLTLIISVIVTLWLIKTKYKVDWVKSILVWIVSAVLAGILMAIVTMVLLGSAVIALGGLSMAG